MSEVKIEHVFKRYGDITVVDDFNLEVKDGEFVSILGPSGRQNDNASYGRRL